MLIENIRIYYISVFQHGIFQHSFLWNREYSTLMVSFLISFSSNLTFLMIFAHPDIRLFFGHPVIRSIFDRCLYFVEDAHTNIHIANTVGRCTLDVLVSVPGGCRVGRKQIRDTWVGTNKIGKRYKKGWNNRGECDLLKLKGSG